MSAYCEIWILKVEFSFSHFLKKKPHEYFHSARLSASIFFKWWNPKNHKRVGNSEICLKMKKRKWSPLAGLMVLCVMVAASLFTYQAFGSGGILPGTGGSTGELPTTVMKGYILTVQRIKTGEHFERFGTLGGEFTRVVSDFTEVTCCLKTNRAMDGCTGFKICDSHL
jgi:hypothetical protein